MSFELLEPSLKPAWYQRMSLVTSKARLSQI